VAERPLQQRTVAGSGRRLPCAHMGNEVATCGHASVVATSTSIGGGSSSSADVQHRRGGEREPASGSAAPSRNLRVGKFQQLLSRPSVDLTALRELLWSGAPEEDLTHRADAWQILLGYLPPVRDRQEQGLAKKRGEYEELKRRHYRFDEEDEGGNGSSSGGVAGTSPGGGLSGSAALSASAAAAAAGTDGDDAVVVLRQIRVDIPRTCGGLPLFGHPRIQRLMERVLYIWSVRHPASGYVQGINDLTTPFIVVLLTAALKTPLEDIDLDNVLDSVLSDVEAGVYWCLTKMLSDIQDHYTSGQPGIQAMVLRLKDIVRRIDEKLYKHLDEQGLDFLQFSFRWMNCLLLREFPLHCVIRLWDTYIAEPTEGFSTFHVYVCAVFLIYWSPQLKQMDFQQLMLFWQKLPTGKWRAREIETLLAEAFVLKSLFHSSPKHLAAPPVGPL